MRLTKHLPDLCDIINVIAGSQASQAGINLENPSEKRIKI